METAVLFYLVMVKKDYENWNDLCKYFPSKTFNEIVQLWVKYSQGHFGFSVQKDIWRSLSQNWFFDKDNEFKKSLL